MKTSILQKRDEDIRINGKFVHYSPPSAKTVEQRLLQYVDRERAMNEKLSAAGIDYEFHGFEDQLKPLGVTYVPKKKPQAAPAGKGILDIAMAKTAKAKTGGGKPAVKKKRKKLRRPAP